MNFVSSLFKTSLRNFHRAEVKHIDVASLCKDNFTSTEEHEKLRATVSKIIDTDINPYVDEWEKEQQFPMKEVFKKLGSAGLLGITREEKYGGLELDYSFTVAFFEELGKINCYGIASSIMPQTNMATPALSKYGSHELKQEFLAPSISGDRIGCIGVSEIQNGSDVAAITTKAVRKGDDLIINGGKMWITNGPKADWMCLLANTSEGNPHKNKSLICLPLNLPGIKFNKIHKMGLLSSEMAQFFFEDVRVPVKNIIGEEGKGFKYQMQQFQEERLTMGCSVIPIMTRTIQETIDFCKVQKTFGQPIINNQVIHYTLSELMVEVEALKSMVYRASAKLMKGEDVTPLTSMVKLKAGRLIRELNDKCLQYWGAMGLSASRSYRDGRAMSIAGGTDEMMLSVISKYMSTLPK